MPAQHTHDCSLRPNDITGTHRLSLHASLSGYAQIGAFLLRWRKAGLFDGLDLDVQETTLAEPADQVAEGRPEQFVADREAAGPS